MKQLALPVAHRRWLIYAVLHTLTVCMELTMALLGSPAGWVLVASVPLAGVSWTGWRKTRPPKLPAAVGGWRTPAFPGGRGCAPGCCPICGMDDPVSLEPCWGGLPAHQDCADWLGELPQLTREQQREQIHHFPTMAGVRPSEMRAILAEMGNPVTHPTEDEIDSFIRRKAREQGMPLDYAVSLTSDAKPGDTALRVEHKIRPDLYTMHSGDLTDDHPVEQVRVTGVGGYTAYLSRPLKYAYRARDFLLPTECSHDWDEWGLVYHGGRLDWRHCVKCDMPDSRDWVDGKSAVPPGPGAATRAE